jgi:hypothetical protein
MFEHFDERARTCIVFAQEEASRLGHGELDTVHMLLGVARVDPALLAVDVEAVRAAVVALQGIGTPSSEAIPISADAKAALEGANRQALTFGHTTIDPAHLLLALIEVGGDGARALRESGAIPGEVRERAGAAAGAGSPSAPGPIGATIADIGRPQLDAHVLELILGAGGAVAHLLREHGIDEATLRERFGASRPRWRRPRRAAPRGR